MLLSIIIPVYNEAQTIQQVLDSITSVNLPSPFDRQILVINDGSTDQTEKLLAQYQNHPQIKIFHHKNNKGKGAAILLGVKEALGDLILIQDADLEYTPDNYAGLLSPFFKEKTDVVYGSRFLGNIVGMTRMNRWANIVSNITFNILFQSNLTDINTGYKIFRSHILKNMDLSAENFDFETEVSAKLVKKNYSIHEVPISYVARKKSQGKKMTWKKALEMYGGIIKFRFTN